VIGLGQLEKVDALMNNVLKINHIKALKLQRTKGTTKEGLRLYLRIKTNYYTSTKEGIRLREHFHSSAAIVY
jgi:hypothetical protein